MKRFWVGALAAVVLAGLANVTIAAEPSTAPVNRIKMNFQNVDIPVLAKFISEITGRNFVIDESVRGKVTIISPTEVTPDQAYSMFQSVLQLKGFTTSPAGKIIKIVPLRNVRPEAQLTQQQDVGNFGDQYVTRMVRLKNVDVTSIVNVIQPLVSHDGMVAAYPEDNTLIITDDAYNVQRLLQIIGSLDVQGTQQSVTVIPLKLAFAGELAPEIDQIMGARGSNAASGGGGPQGGGRGLGIPQAMAVGPAAFKVIPDERTNSLVVLAGPVQMRQIQEIVAKLDVQSPNAMSRIHVYHLKNAQALEMVQVLQNLLGGGGMPTTLSPTTGRGSLGRGSSLGLYNGSSFGSGFGGLGNQMMSSGSSSAGYGGMGSSMGGGMGGSMGGMGGGSMGMMRHSGTGSTTGGTGTATAASGKSPDFNSPVSITADPATNALIVSASPQDWQVLHTIIDDLDLPRVQVFVQAVIVEVQAERAREIGINWMGNTQISGSTLGVGQLNFGQLQNALGNPLGMSGLGIGLASGKCSIPTTIANAASNVVNSVTPSNTPSTTTSSITVPCDVALMTALETDTHANVLSAPTLLTADNEEAMIVVGENLPFVGSAAANAGLPGQIFNSVDRQNVGITLDVVPQVSEGDYVKMDLYEEVSNVVPGTASATLGPTTTIRSASTSVLVEDHRTAVIGGLLSSDDTKNNAGVPFISSLPVIGNLFSNRQSDKQKDNLIVFLTPHVVRNRADLRSLAIDERQKFVSSLGRKELHDMPASQVRELYKPSFSIPVPPSADANASVPVAPGPENPEAGGTPFNSTGGGGGGSSPGVATPFNTEEIGPSTMNKTAAPSTAPAAAVASSTTGSPAIGLDPSGTSSTPVSAPAATVPLTAADATGAASAGGALGATKAIVSTPPSP